MPKTARRFLVRLRRAFVSGFSALMPAAMPERSPPPPRGVTTVSTSGKARGKSDALSGIAGAHGPHPFFNCSGGNCRTALYKPQILNEPVGRQLDTNQRGLDRGIEHLLGGIADCEEGDAARCDRERQDGGIVIV